MAWCVGASQCAHTFQLRIETISGLLYSLHAVVGSLGCRVTLWCLQKLPGEAGIIRWAWPPVVCWCSTACTHLPIIALDNRIWFTVFSPCCCTHRPDRRSAGCPGAFWCFLAIFIVVVIVALTPGFPDFQGCRCVVLFREANLSDLIRRQTVE